MARQSTGSKPAAEQVVKTACGLCPCECGMDVTVREGEITKVEGMAEHPYNRGQLCVKGRASRDFVYHKDRLRHPMKKEDGGWKRISWDEALDTIAGKLTEIKEKYGATSFCASCGDPMESRGATGAFPLWRFMDAYGSPNTFYSDPCFRVRAQAQIMTFGFLRFVMSADIENSKCIVLWAHNPHKSDPVGALPRIEAARKKGAKLAVIDPRRTAYAKVADVHIQPRPGTDGALMLAMLNTIISEGLFDREFVEKWTLGFDRLAECVRPWTAEKAATIAGVPAEQIKEIARMFATIKPACIVQGWGSLDQTASGFQNSRSACILHAITGNVDKRGGYRQVALPPIDGLRLWDRMSSAKPPNADAYPLLSGEMGVMLASATAPVAWVDSMFREEPYKMRAMYIGASNPAVSMPNTAKITQVLRNLDFLFVMDVFMTPTAELADIVLPACTNLERNDIIHIFHTSFGGVPHILLGKQAIQPLWESWPDWKFFAELAKKMGYAEDFPWKSDLELIDQYLSPSGVTVKQLTEDSPSGIPCGTVKTEEYFEQHPEEPRFPTPSGKVELYSETLEKAGIGPLPSFTEPAEGPVANPELAREYPLILTTGARLLEYWHSGYRDMPELRKRMPEALVEIHPDSAAQYGVNDGEMAVVETKRGSIEIRVKATEDIIPGVVSIPHGWAQANVNVITDDAPSDKESGYPALKSQLCRIRGIT